MGPADLAQVLRRLPPGIPNPDLLVGLETADDAGVYRLSDEVALVQSVDFFTPVVDDPYAYGRIAAANALSDIYAMGARPVTALNLVAFPQSLLNTGILAEILRGGSDALQEAGVTLVGGHSIDDAEPKYGMAVTGIVHPQRIWRNAGARVGDVLVLTKPIGVGAVTQGIKAGVTPPDQVEHAVQIMARLNRDAWEAALSFTVHAATDVTGYGLLGHALEMARGAEGGLRLRLADVPVLPGARDLIARGIHPGGTRKNLEAVEPHTRFSRRVEPVDRLLLADAVTSGGLLLAVPSAEADGLCRALARQGTFSQAVVGEVARDLPPGTIEVL